MNIFDFAMVQVLEAGDFITFHWGGDVVDPTTGELGIGQDYFIAGLVPIPAALPLFLSGLFGFAFFSRKKTKQAIA